MPRRQFATLSGDLRAADWPVQFCGSCDHVRLGRRNFADLSALANSAGESSRGTRRTRRRAGLSEHVAPVGEGARHTRCLSSPSDVEESHGTVDVIEDGPVRRVRRVGSSQRLGEAEALERSTSNVRADPVCESALTVTRMFGLTGGEAITTIAGPESQRRPLLNSTSLRGSRGPASRGVAEPPDDTSASRLFPARSVQHHWWWHRVWKRANAPSGSVSSGRSIRPRYLPVMA